MFTEEALKAQDGKKTPLTLEVGGRVIGEATLRYDEETKELKARFRVDDPDVAAYLSQDTEAVIFKNPE